MDILHSDNGTEFVNEVMTNLCDWLGIIRTTTTAYHPQGNGMCERANRSLKQALTCLLLEYGTGWYTALPFALWSLRSAIHRVTGYAPYQVLFAKHMRTPYDFIRLDQSRNDVAIANSDVSSTSENSSPYSACHDASNELIGRPTFDTGKPVSDVKYPFANVGKRYEYLSIGHPASAKS